MRIAVVMPWQFDMLMNRQREPHRIPFFQCPHIWLESANMIVVPESECTVRNVGDKLDTTVSLGSIMSAMWKVD